MSNRAILPSTSVLFGESQLNARSKYRSGHSGRSTNSSTRLDPTAYPYVDDPHQGRRCFEDDDATTSFWFSIPVWWPGSRMRSLRHAQVDGDDYNNNCNYNHHRSSVQHHDDHDQYSIASSRRPEKGTWADFIFGFLYDEDPYYDDADGNEDLAMLTMSGPSSSHLVPNNADDSTSQPHLATCTIWMNPIHLLWFVTMMLTSAATAVPVVILSSMGNDFLSTDNYPSSSKTNTIASVFAPHAAAAAVLGTSIGKFINGPVSDMMGARRASSLYSIGMAIALIGLAVSWTAPMAIRACFWVDFCSSVQWPCCLITLAAHSRCYRHSTNRNRVALHSGMYTAGGYRNNSSGSQLYEGGIFVTSLGSRMGSLLGIPLFSLLLRCKVHWRWLALLGSWSSLVASSMIYLYGQDSPDHCNHPQNPIDPNLMPKWFPHLHQQRRPWTVRDVLRLSWLVVQANLVPSIRHIVSSGTFWIVALAHTGASMVRTSDHIMARYLLDTNPHSQQQHPYQQQLSNNDDDGIDGWYLTEDRASALAVFLSVGIALGLWLGGTVFSQQYEDDRARKWLVSRLYLLSIASCYVLAACALPLIRAVVVPQLLLTVQIVAITATGFGIAVQLTQIPSLVGATYGCDKGLFAAYTDGVAYGLASIVWCIVGRAIQQHQQQQQQQQIQQQQHHDYYSSTGWAYGWAAVALLLIMSSLLMVEFMEHYFCRPRAGGTYETIIFA